MQWLWSSISAGHMDVSSIIHVQEIECQHSDGHCGLLAPSETQQWALYGPKNEHKGKLDLWQSHVVA